MDKIYYCSHCNKDVDSEICPTCFSPAQLKTGDKTGTSQPGSSATTARPAPTAARSIPASASSRSASHPPRAERPTIQPQPSTAAGSKIETAEVSDFLSRGYDVFLIAGIFEAGKTQLLKAYEQNGYLQEISQEQGRVLPTPPQSLKCYTVEAGRRKVMFLDAAGELFRQLYPALRETKEIGEPEIEFLRLVSHRLRGVILLLDLGRLWGPEKANAPANALQVEVLSWVLALLRWLRLDGEYQPGPISLQKHVNSQLKIRRRRLNVPVQVLFSKADRLKGLIVPQVSAMNWLQGGTGVHRTLFPVGEDPLLLAYHCLPDLFDAVERHAKYFRFDFVHSLVTDRDTEEVIDKKSCGVTLSLQWLLDSTWQRPWPMLPAGFWLGLQKFVDGTVSRNKRWRSLPDPVEVRT